MKALRLLRVALGIAILFLGALNLLLRTEERRGDVAELLGADLLAKLESVPIWLQFNALGSESVWGVIVVGAILVVLPARRRKEKPGTAVQAAEDLSSGIEEDDEFEEVAAEFWAANYWWIVLVRLNKIVITSSLVIWTLCMWLSRT